MLLERRMPFLTYPLRPFSCRGASQNKAFSNWAFEPKANGWRCLVDLEEGVVWSRHGKPFSMASQVMSVVRGDGYNFGAVRWLDCELLGRRTKTGAGSVLLLDVVGDGTYAERRDWLSVLLECPWDDIPKGRFLRLPSFTQSEALQNIETMKAVNTLRKEVVWEGVVCKHPLSKYETQTRSPDAECRFWAKDRFI
jgi:ATP-dependent DNA ligase